MILIFAITSEKLLVGNGFIFQHDSDLKHAFTPNAVKT